MLSSSAWGAVIADIHMLEKAEGENVFTITLDLYEGDQFQFATDSDWMTKGIRVHSACGSHRDDRRRDGDPVLGRRQGRQIRPQRRKDGTVLKGDGRF